MSHLDLHLAEGLALEEIKSYDTKGTDMKLSRDIEEDEVLSPTLSKVLGKQDGKRQRDAPVNAKATKQKKKPRSAGQLGVWCSYFFCGQRALLLFGSGLPC